MKALLFISLTFLMVSCSPSVQVSSDTDIPTPVVKITPSATRPAEPDNWMKETSMALKASLPTTTETGCLKLIAPKNGETYTGGKQVTFQWEAMPGVKYYVFLLINPDGPKTKIKTSEPSTIQEAKASPRDAIYYWSVDAYDAQDKLLCTSETFELIMLPAGRSKTPVQPVSTKMSPATSTDYPSIDTSVAPPTNTEPPSATEPPTQIVKDTPPPTEPATEPPTIYP